MTGLRPELRNNPYEPEPFIAAIGRDQMESGEMDDIDFQRSATAKLHEGD